jgi:hypothetical protein
MCSRAFPFSAFLRLLSCRLYSRMCAPCSICALNIPNYCYCFLLPVMCSLYLVLNVRPVCPIYFNGQSIHFIWCTPLVSYSSYCRRGFTKFCMVFFVRNAILIFVSLKSFAISFVSFP